jgi:hypothetical protein
MAYKKCKICNESIIGEEGVPYKGRTVHQKCFNIVVKTLQKNKVEKITEAEEKKKRGRASKPKAELKSGLSEEEYKEKQDYYNYIRSIVGKEELSAKTYALSEDYIKRYGFTFFSMHRTLIYLHEIISKELTGDIVGIIPYYHTEALQYFSSLLKVEELNKNINTSGMYKEKIIQIKPSKRRTKQISIESIGKEDDG